MQGLQLLLLLLQDRLDLLLLIRAEVQLLCQALQPLVGNIGV